MDVQITPEPSPEEREAIVRALELELEAEAEPSPWQRAMLSGAEKVPAPVSGAGTWSEGSFRTPD